MGTSDNTWYVLRSGRSVGPMSDVELALLARNGIIGADDHIWCQGLTDWVRAGSLEGFLPKPIATPTSAAQRRPSAAGPITAQYETALAARSAPPATGQSMARGSTVVSGTRSQTFSAAQAEPGSAWERALAASLPRSADVGRAVERASSPVPRSAIESRSPVSPREHAPAAGGGSSYLPSELMSPEFRRSLAESIVRVLARLDIRTVDDLTSDQRLQVVAAYTYDSLPGSIRLMISLTVKRPAVETLVFGFLCKVRSGIPAGHGPNDLQAAILELAATPWISEQLSEIFTKARSGLSSFVSNVIPSADAASSWAQSAKLAWMNRPALAALPPPPAAAQT